MEIGSMNKIASDIMDYIEDGRFEELAKMFGGLSDEFTKTAHIPSKLDITSIPNENFAVVLITPGESVEKKYQCDSPELTKLNTALFIKDKDALPTEVVKTASYFLGIAATKFGLSEEVYELAKLAEKQNDNFIDTSRINKTGFAKKLDVVKNFKRESIEKSGNWALPDMEKYPLNTSEDVQQAIDYFTTYEDKFKQAEKFVFSVNTAKAARDLNVKVNPKTDKIAKYASLNMFNLGTNAKYFLRTRKNLAGVEFEDVYNELEEKLASYENNPMALSELLTQLDMKTGLSRLWGTVIEEPITTCMDSIKTSSMKIDSKEVSLTELQKIQNHPKTAEYLDSDTIQDLGGPEGLEIFASLPKPVRLDLMNLI
jgi:hypothetical protein